MWSFIPLVKALANEDTLLPTHCYRHKCFPVCPRAQHLLRTQKLFLILFRNILCPQQMFPSLRSPRNIVGNNVSATMCPRLPGPLEANSWSARDPKWKLAVKIWKLTQILRSCISSVNRWFGTNLHKRMHTFETLLFLRCIENLPFILLLFDWKFYFKVVDANGVVTKTMNTKLSK